MCCEIVWWNSVDLNLFSGHTCCNLKANEEGRIRFDRPYFAFLDSLRKTPGYLYNSGWIISQHCLFHRQKWWWCRLKSSLSLLYFKKMDLCYITNFKSIYKFILCVTISRIRHEKSGFRVSYWYLTVSEATHKRTKAMNQLPAYIVASEYIGYSPTYFP